MRKSVIRTSILVVTLLFFASNTTYGEIWRLEEPLDYTGDPITAPVVVEEGDFTMTAVLRVETLDHTAAGIMLGTAFFGFDASDNRLFVQGGSFGETRMLTPATDYFQAGEQFTMTIRRKDGVATVALNDEQVFESPLPDSISRPYLRPHRSRMAVVSWEIEGELTSCVPHPTTTLFRGTKDAALGTHTYRIPALLTTGKGTILAFAEARRDGRSDTCNIDTVLRRSEDGGETWGEEIIAFDLDDGVSGNPCPVLDRDTGRIWLLSTWNSRTTPESKTATGYGEDSRRVYVSYSDDDGLTWVGPKEITSDVKRENWSWYATGPGAAIQIERGDFAGRLIIPCDHKAVDPDGNWTYHSHVIYSDDHGETWRIGGSTPHGTNECGNVELSDGQLMLNSRNHGVTDNRRHVAISKDGGATFVECRRDETLIEPRCQASIRRFSWPKGDALGVILFSNPAATTRRNMTLRGSLDDGKTWTLAKTLYPDSAAYSDIAILPDGRIGVLFEIDDYAAIELAIVDIWLLDEAP